MCFVIVDSDAHSVCGLRPPQIVTPGLVIMGMSGHVVYIVLCLFPWLMLLVCSLAQDMDTFRKKTNGSNVINDFYKDLESEVFPHAIIKEHYPDRVAEWQVIAKTQSVPWEWIMFCELALTFVWIQTLNDTFFCDKLTWVWLVGFCALCKDSEIPKQYRMDSSGHK